MTSYQNLTILLFMYKHSKIYDLMLQISLRSFSSHNAKRLYKRILKYNLRSCGVTLLSNPKIKKIRYWYVVDKAAKLWSRLPRRNKNLSSLDLFKSKIKKLHYSACPCKICRIFVDREFGCLLWGFSLDKVANFIWG